MPSVQPRCHLVSAPPATGSHVLQPSLVLLPNPRLSRAWLAAHETPYSVHRILIRLPHGDGTREISNKSGSLMPFHEWLLPRYHLSIAPHRILRFAAFWGPALLLPRHRLPKDPAYCSILWSRLGTLSASTRTGSRALQPYLVTLRQRLGITSQMDPKFRNILCSCFGTASAPPPTASYVLQPSVVLPRYAFGTTSAPSRLSTASDRIPCFGTSLIPLLYCIGNASHRIQILQHFVVQP
jgi:hypothetical protein